MSEITLPVADDAAETLQVAPSEVGATLQLAAAMKLFERAGGPSETRENDAHCVEDAV